MITKLLHNIPMGGVGKEHVMESTTNNQSISKTANMCGPPCFAHQIIKHFYFAPIICHRHDTQENQVMPYMCLMATLNDKVEIRCTNMRSNPLWSCIIRCQITSLKYYGVEESHFILDTLSSERIIQCHIQSQHGPLEKTPFLKTKSGIYQCHIVIA